MGHPTCKVDIWTIKECIVAYFKIVSFSFLCNCKYEQLLLIILNYDIKDKRSETF